MTEVVYKKRKPAIAVMLSMLCLGLGHIYCGRLVTGLVVMLASLLPMAFVLVATISSNVNVIFLIAVMLPSILWTFLYCYAFVDSYRLAKRIGGNYELKDYNRGIVYALLIAADIVASLAIAPVLAMYVREHLVEAFVGASDSMNPTILQGERVLVNKLLQRKLPQRGDVVVFLYPDNRDVRYIKRVVGLPGDAITVRGNDIYVNGQKLKHEPIAVSDSNRTSAEDAGDELTCETNGEATYRIRLAADAEKAVDYPETKVPKGHCFVLGDNRNQADDSRRFGPVPLGDILGKAQYIYWPMQRWSRFGPIDE